MKYLEINTIFEVHDSIIDKTWGVRGVKDEWQIESLLFHIQNDEYYPHIVDKLTHLFFWLVQFHCFIDGNKRTATIIANTFLDINEIHVENFILKLEDISIWVAKWEITKDMLKHIFASMFISFWYL